ncbi:MAG TPA: 16S rRNA (cytosine(1402)-N(4))-methyltransferase RsmH [Actinomycetota bacterium]|nr:16S rRNA (cytosine(1402)-N(4))-methyltransferase RsmH [Actinomycetota bacterium]
MDHEPVLADSVVELLLPALQGGGVFVDATVGRGGHSARLLEAAPQAEVIALDRDGLALEESKSNLAAYAQRVRTHRANFSSLETVLERFGSPPVRGVLFDLGVSSPQLDTAGRGFSYRSEGPLDMRMDPSQPLSAATVVNEYPEGDLARVIKQFGEERFSARVARAIVAARPIGSTTRLADVVKNAIPAATRRTGGHPARRTFQAIRIEVNDELRNLERGLAAAHDVLDPGGRIVALTYHSLEDRIVKNFFNEAADGCTCPPDFPVCACGASATLRVLTRRPLRPGDAEMKSNPRASAAKLRAAEKLGDAVAGEDAP